VSGRADRALAHVRARGAAGALSVPDARITISFHPDRLLPDGRSVAEHLLAEVCTAASSRPASPTAA